MSGSVLCSRKYRVRLSLAQVIFCTIAKSSSTEWRRLLNRVHDDQTKLDDGRPAWCGSSSNLLNTPTSPPLVRSLHHFHELKRSGYRSAVWLRNPYERAGSMYTGTAHTPAAGGVAFADRGMSFDQFVHGPLPDLASADPRRFSVRTILENNSSAAPVVGGDGHFLPQMLQCNFGVPTVSAHAPRWDIVGTSGDNATDTYERVSAFVRRVFGSPTYKRVAAGGWCVCGHWWTGNPANWTACAEEPFFAPHTSKGSGHFAGLSEVAVSRIHTQIRRVYAEDVAYYEWNRELRNADGSAPGDPGCK